MIHVSLKQNDVPCRVAPHPIHADRSIRSMISELEVLPRHNEAIAKALGHGPERRRPNGGYGLKVLRGRIAKACLAELKQARDCLVEDENDGEVTFTAYSALNLLIWWAEAYPEATFSVT